MDTIKLNQQKAKVIAHRGLSGIEKENTCPAFIAAANRSYFGIETDIHVTKDKKFVVIHDETTKRITNGKYDIKVEESNYEDIANIILPDKDGAYIRHDIKIPLLCDYIAICKKYAKKCVLEIKNPFTVEDLEKVIREIKELRYLENVIFISFILENCINLRKLLPKSEIQWLLHNIEITDEIINTLKDNNFALDINYKALTKENIKLLHDNNVCVNCWTCDDASVANELISYGVDFITTNILE